MWLPWVRRVWGGFLTFREALPDTRCLPVLAQAQDLKVEPASSSYYCSSVILGKLPKLTEPQLCHVQDGDDIIYLTDLV